ncbi:aspergillopepsin-2 [Grosmannia clavigera kw1407]|uniref:Aspergillopepsin-2 n=1 Tax=Grosmannia clavigera (strain kw1407 / UAMH 11150) TaxID=655863 RepID=F0XRX3_GROCL|nr:aspergillopepsin-2 [Grosmannia clavigera kw1407]EFW99492.1 aspergillopepsin-2 [Grosmannia clavigera kw1407]
MKFSAAVAATLCASALAAPAPAPAPARSVAKNQGLARKSRLSRANQLQQKRTSSPTFGHAAGHRTGLNHKAATSAITTDHSAATEVSETTDDSVEDWLNGSWSGVVVQPGAGDIVGVSATFALPNVKLPTDGAQVKATTHTASAWVGIDGYSCGTGLWQAGVDGNVDESGAVSWYAWYEWYPAGTIVVDLGDLGVGDKIFVNVTASSTTHGSVYMENLAAGKSFSKDVTSTDELCLADAEWIQEDLVADSTAEGQADFGTITFANATAYTKTGTLPPTSDTNLMDIKDSNNRQLTSTTYTKDAVIIKYL